jgi:Transposase DDE domain group 1
MTSQAHPPQLSLPPERDPETRLDFLVNAFGLTTFDTVLLLLAVGAEIETDFPLLCAQVFGLDSGVPATIDLAQRLTKYERAKGEDAADAGFSLPEILQVCERFHVGYAIGFSRNAVLERKIADLLERARLQHIQTQQKARLFDDVYSAAKCWDEPRRLVMKAEWLDNGPNPRLVVTNLEQPPQKLYDHFYVQRGGDNEQRIKELKLGIKADRLSCTTFIAIGLRPAVGVQFRLLLAQAAYILMLAIRQAANKTQLATAQVERL